MSHTTTDVTFYVNNCETMNAFEERLAATGTIQCIQTRMGLFKAGNVAPLSPLAILYERYQEEWSIIVVPPLSWQWRE